MGSQSFRLTALKHSENFSFCFLMTLMLMILENFPNTFFHLFFSRALISELLEVKLFKYHQDDGRKIFYFSAFPIRSHLFNVEQLIMKGTVVNVPFSSCVCLY